MLSNRPISCVGCPLHDEHLAQGFMSPEGTGSAGVLVMAEALGEKEAYDSLPLRPKAPAGSVFQGIIRRIPGLDRSQLLLSNTIWCRPGPKNWLDGAPYEFAAIEHCQHNNAKLVQLRRPRAILALGAIPFRTLTGMVGHNQGIKMVRGYPVASIRPEYMIDGKPIPVIGTFHPSYLMRGSKTRSKDQELVAGKVEKSEGGMTLVGVIMRDIELAMHVAAHGMFPRPELDLVKGSPEAMRDLIEYATAKPELPLAWDIETPRSWDNAADESEIDQIQAKVEQIQFALDPVKAYVFRGFDVRYILEGSRHLLGLKNKKLTWNGKKFDNKVVAGFYEIPILGEDLDLMQAWHWLQPDLPQGLQFATSFFAPELGPWKHMAGDQDDYYGMMDVISLQRNHPAIFRALEHKKNPYGGLGLHQSFDRHVQKLDLELIAASKRGFPMDPVKHREFGESIEETIKGLDAKIQALVPESILNIEPKRKTKKGSTEYGYVRTPKQLADHLDEQGNPKNGTDRIYIEELVPVQNDDGEDTQEMELKRTTYVRRDVEVWNAETLDNDLINRWCRLKPFSVGSTDQKIRYILHKRAEDIAKRVAKGQKLDVAERNSKYIVPRVKNKQKQVKDNTGNKELEKLAKSTDDPVFNLFVDIAKNKKMWGTYYRGWQFQNKEGKWISPEYAHTTFGAASTGTGQLSSKDPNVQNAPKHSALGKKFRAVISAKTGRKLLEFDKKAFHAQTLAFEAKDKVYARISALDVHSFTTNIRLKLHSAAELLKMSDKDMGALFTEQKGDDDHPGPIFKSEGCVAYPDGMTFQQVRDFKSKRVILGIGFCQGPGTIYEQNPEGYKDKKEVEAFLDIVKGIIPDVFKFQKHITQVAHKQGNLVSRWGYIRRFYDVFQWDANKWNPKTQEMGDWKQGDDYESAVAFYPSNDAFGMLKEEMLRLAGYRIEAPGEHTPDDPILFKAYQDHKLSWTQYLQERKIIGEQVSENLFEKYSFINQIHDSLMFHPWANLVDKCIEDVLRIMREPCLTLSDPEMAPNGLYVDAEGAMGDDWAHMGKIKGV